MNFPNYAGHSDVDQELANELELAGITVEKMPEFWRERSGEVTFREAIVEAKLPVMAKQRLKVVQRDLFEQLDRVAGLERARRLDGESGSADLPRDRRHARDDGRRPRHRHHGALWRRGDARARRPRVHPALATDRNDRAVDGDQLRGFDAGASALLPSTERRARQAA